MRMQIRARLRRRLWCLAWRGASCHGQQTRIVERWDAGTLHFILANLFGLLKMANMRYWWTNTNRDKSLRHLVMVAKFLDENKAKTSLKKRIRTVSNVIDLIQFHLICKNLAKLSEVESERMVSKLRKIKIKFLCCVHQLHKAGAWN